MTLDGLRTAIKSKLDSLSGSGQVLTIAYDYHETAPAGFPAASFEPLGIQNQMFTTDDNLIGYSFEIVIQQEFSSITRSAAVGILCRALDSIIAAFNADSSLSGACNYTIPVNGSFGFFEGANGSILWTTLTLICFAEVAV